jgi:tRNA/rRNA methyltransferase
MRSGVAIFPGSNCDRDIIVALKKSTELANVGDREYFYEQLDNLLTESGFFYSPEMAPTVKRNIRSLFNRASLSHQDLRTLHGIIRSLSGNLNRT